jgi:hypothetical protein
MKNLTVLFLLSCLSASCGIGEPERPLTATCTPAVKLNVHTAADAPPPSTQPASPAHREAVQVYWDISQSMRDFSVTRRGTKRLEAWSDDLTPVVATLDSSVLLRAHAETVEQYGVGESIQRLSGSAAALHPTASRTALHLAAQQLGTALATGTAQAALVVSDMELDAPPRASTAGTVCGGVPLPSTREAGTLFGRCLENASLAVQPVGLIRNDLLVHVFRKRSHDRELFILLLATDVAFGHRISDEIVGRLHFARHVIFDSDFVAAANVRGCTVTTGSGVVMRRGGCSAKCFDSDTIIQAQCDIRDSSSDAWIYPAPVHVQGATYEEKQNKDSTGERQAVLRFSIPCSTPPGRFRADLPYEWRQRPVASQGSDDAFAQKESVRDLFDSLTDSIIRIVAQRQLQIGIDLLK